METMINGLVVPALPLVSFLLWVYSIYQARLGITGGIGELGLVSVLPLSFFLSLSLLTVCFLTTLKVSKSQTALFCEVMMLILSLYLSPAIIEGTPRFSSTYVYYRAVDYISQVGHTNPTLQWVHAWPAFSIVFSALVQTTALARTPGEQVFLSLYPTLSNIAVFFPVFGFIRMVIPQERVRWIAVWLFYIANWIDQFFFSVQSFGFFTFILLILVAFKIMDLRGRGNSWLYVSMLLFCYLVTSHLLSALAYLATILSLFIFRRFRKPWILALSGLVVVTWTIYGATVLVPWAVSQVVSHALNLEFIFYANIAERATAGSAAHVTVAQIRIIFSALVVMFALCGLILAWKSRKFAKMERRILLVLLGLSSLFGLFAYGGELFMRIFLLSVLPLVYFVCKGLNNKRFLWAVLVFLVIVAPPMHIIAQYGNEANEYVPVSESRGTEFFKDATARGYVIGDPYFRDLRYGESYRYFPLSDTYWTNNTLSLDRIRRGEWPTFVCLSYYTRQRHSLLIGEPQFVPETVKNLTASTRYDKIYSNPGFEVYLERPD